MAEEYGRLALLKEITTKSGATSKELIVYRPTCRTLLEVFEVDSSRVQVERFVRLSVRAINGSADAVPQEFEASQLLTGDGSELASAIASLRQEADEVTLPPDNGDGIMAPLVYNLVRPIKMSPRPDAETIEQIAFEAKRMGDVTDFLDATKNSDQFRAFMRGFATPLGVSGSNRMMSDALIDALDAVDYLVIRGPLVMGKFNYAQGRWKRTH